MSYSPCYEIPAACHRVLGWFLEGGELLGLSHVSEYMILDPPFFCIIFIPSKLHCRDSLRPSSYL